MIFIDRRERIRKDQPLFPYLYSIASKLNPPIRIQEQELAYGDISFTGLGPREIPHLVGVERKTISDLIGCIHDGRFAGHQLPGLASSYNSVWLLVEGDFQRGPGGELLVRRGRYLAPPPGQPIAYAGVESWLHTAEICGGVYVRRSRDVAESADFVFGLYRWWQRPWEDHRSHLAFDDSNELREVVQTSLPTLLRRFAKELPGIGWTRSKHVERRFGTVEEAVSASKKDWMSIEGVGKTLAERIWAALRTRGSR